MTSQPRRFSGTAFGRFWLAAAINSFGSAITAVAMPVLVVQLLAATPLEVGLVNAAQFLPYALLGLLAGVYTDRWRRKPIIVWSSAGRAVTLGAIPVLWLLGALQVWVLIGLLFVFGAFSVFAFAGTQSLLPRIVRRSDLVVANSRLDQTDAAAQTLGPALGGGLVALVGAPLAVAIDAISYLVDAALNATLRVDEQRVARRDRRLGREIAEGLRSTYRHPTLGALAVSTHVWFFANAAGLIALSLLALRSLGFTALAYGFLLAGSGIASVIGATAAPAVGRRLGSGAAVVAARVAYPVGWLLVLVAAALPDAAPVLFVALALLGLVAGVENANEMGYWQAVTPDDMLGRVNATRRSMNRTVAALGAFAGGASVALLGDAPTLLGVVLVFAVSAIIVALSPLRGADVTA